MKLLLFSDLHCDAAAARSLVERAPEADLLIGAGDFASMRRGLEICLPILLETGKPLVCVPGNNESLDELRAACDGYANAHVLHGGGLSLNGAQFWGLGGGVPVTPFGAWSYDFSEDKARELSRDCPARAILISHSPPHGAVDLSSRGQHMGSVAVRETIERTRPKLVICGHIHNCAGQSARIGDSEVVNAGPQGLWRDL